MNKEKFKILTVDNDHEDSRLDRFVKRHVDDLKQSQIEKMARKGFLRINGKKATCSDRVAIGDEVWYLPPLVNEEQTSNKTDDNDQKNHILSHEDMKFFQSMIIWEDEDLLVLNKPHGLSVQGGSKVSKHIDGLLQGYNALKQTNYRLVHRLDKDTSGVLIIGKNLRITKHLAEQFKQNTISKIYWAITHGIIEPAMGIIDLPLLKEKVGSNEKIIVDHKVGKKSITKYHTMKRLVKRSRGETIQLTFVELHPQTGRTHQLRVHCQSLGHPILGDIKYGYRDPENKKTKLHLHARSICVTDLTGHKFTFTAPAPEHIENTLQVFSIDPIM